MTGFQRITAIRGAASCRVRRSSASPVTASTGVTP